MKIVQHCIPAFTFQFMIPKHSDVLGICKDTKSPTLTIMHSDNSLETRYFRVYESGDALDILEEPQKYIGTFKGLFVTDGRLGHVFEILK